MASSDDEGEVVPGYVSEYEFVDAEDEPISFAELPIHWNKNQIPDGEQKQIFLRGTSDKGLQRIFKQVEAWKFDLSDKKPEIFVLSKENNWIKLLKPRNAFKDTIRTILVTVQYLHCVKWNPEKSQENMWEHLSVVLRSFKPMPSENDLVNHISLINEAIARGETLAKSKDIVNNDDTNSKEEDNKSDEEEDRCESVCAICDNGGSLFCCEGKCMRSFHPTVKDGADSYCKSLGYTDAEMEELENVDFYCKNCEYKQHQCFVCGELGSSDKSSEAEVFRCDNGDCGNFYHPRCVVELLHSGNKIEAEKQEKKIAAGEPFACPLHKCYVCEELEVKSEPDLQFAICRRCPKAYHRKCLPTEILYEKDEYRGIPQRAWDGLFPNRILIYCLDHDIIKRIKTPVRNHIKFPGVEDNNKRQTLGSSDKKKVVSKERGAAPHNIAAKKSEVKPSKGVEESSFGAKQGDLSKKRGRNFSGPESSKKHKVMDVHEPDMEKSSLRKSNGTSTSKPKISSGEKSRIPRPVISSRVERSDGKLKQTPMFKLDAGTKKRILAMIEEVSSSVTLENALKKHKAASTHTQSPKKVTTRKVEGSVEAVRASIQKLEGTSSVKNGKAVCDTDILDQVMKSKKKLKVNLVPFLHGMHYPSSGRHLTKKDKLKEIVDMLHWYVQGGDTIVDFCCGSNDFSCLMKKKLDETGKSCSYKNYDIVQAKNDFSFEKKSWMDVQAKELPKGSKLIMGLNPPFGVNADLDNEFINKALEFKPKLLILIVPQKTQRLDEKEFPYDLIWENDQMLAGKSFYLPGSVDANDEQTEELNVNPPPLYLWSRPDWTDKHKSIAEQHGHSSRTGEKKRPEKEQQNLGKSSTVIDDDSHVDNKKEAGEGASGTEGNKNDDSGKNQSIKNCKGTRKWRLKRRPNVKSSGDKSTGSRSVDAPCISEVDKSYERDVDISSRVHLHRTEAPDSESQTKDCVSNAGPGLPSSSGQEVSQLDELNHTRLSLNGIASGPHLADRKNIDPPVPRPVFLANSFYFGPFRPSPNSTVGWLDE